MRRQPEGVIYIELKSNYTSEFDATFVPKILNIRFMGNFTYKRLNFNFLK
jgi:hypothetical protein